MITFISYGNWIVMYSSVETDWADIYTPRLPIGRNLHKPKKNHGFMVMLNNC